MLNRSENKWIPPRIGTILRSTGEGKRAFVGLAPGCGSLPDPRRTLAEGKHPTR